MNLTAPNPLPSIVRKTMAVLLALATGASFDRYSLLLDADLVSYYDREFGNRKIKAIKFLRTARPDMGLKEAKEYIEQVIIPHTLDGREAEIAVLKRTIQATIEDGYSPSQRHLRRLADLLDAS